MWTMPVSEANHAIRILPTLREATTGMGDGAAVRGMRGRDEFH